MKTTPAPLLSLLVTESLGAKTAHKVAAWKLQVKALSYLWKRFLKWRCGGLSDRVLVWTPLHFDLSAIGIYF